MEATKNAALAAVRAAWGNTDRSAAEPPSGVQGDTSSGEPYDAGNVDHSNDSRRNGQVTERSEKDEVATKDHGDNSDADLPAGQGRTNSEGAEPPGPPAGISEEPDDSGAPGADRDATTQGEGRPENAGGSAGASTDAKEDRPAGASQEEEEDGEGEGVSASMSYTVAGPGADYRSSGLAKYGGDFDSKKPGAGREAKREYLSVPPQPHFSEDQGLEIGPGDSLSIDPANNLLRFSLQDSCTWAC